jgi:hypothetical protein
MSPVRRCGRRAQSNGHKEARAFKRPGLTHCRPGARSPLRAAIPLSSVDPSPTSGKKDWTLPQRIRTFAEMAFEVALLETEAPPKYQKIAENSLHLNQLGLSNEAIARHIGVYGKTVAKAMNWIRDRS